jgi:glycine C-acetyltransferase
MIPKGKILLRLIPTADHTFEEGDLTSEALKKIKKSLEEGVYNKELSEVGV